VRERNAAAEHGFGDLGGDALFLVQVEAEIE